MLSLEEPSLAAREDAEGAPHGRGGPMVPQGCRYMKWGCTEGAQLSALEAESIWGDVPGPGPHYCLVIAPYGSSGGTAW